MFDVQGFIGTKQRQIEKDRSSSRWLRVFGELIRWIVVPAFAITSLIKGFILTPENYRFDPMGMTAKMQKIGESLSDMIEQHLGFLWSVMLWLSPYPRFSQPIPWLEMAGWIVTLYGLIGLAIAAIHRSKALAKRADKAEERLENNYPMLMHIRDQQQSQRNRVGDVIGDANTIHQENTIQNIFREEKDRDTLKKYLISILIGVIIHIISKLIHAG